MTYKKGDIIETGKNIKLLSIISIDMDDNSLQVAVVNSKANISYTVLHTEVTTHWVLVT